MSLLPTTLAAVVFTCISLELHRVSRRTLRGTGKVTFETVMAELCLGMTVVAAVVFWIEVCARLVSGA